MNFSEDKYCIYGTGGWARETLCCLIDRWASAFTIDGDTAVFMEADEYYKDSSVMGIPVIKESEFSPNNYRVVVAVIRK